MKAQVFAHALSLIFFLAHFAGISFAESFTGKVVGVSDGDTIRVMREGKEAKVRLYGVDCPESSQDFGNKAKQFTSQICFALEVKVDVRDTDRYGRTVGDVVFRDGRHLNQELLKAGLAWWYQQYAPNDATLQALEAEARSAKFGLWSMPNPVAPWDFRRGSSSRPARSVDPRESTDAANEVVSAPQGAGDAKQVVYVTASGSKYHSDGCRYLAKSKVPMALDVAAGSYAPCSMCNPPVLDVPKVSGSVVSTPRMRGPPAAYQPTPIYAPAPAQQSADQMTGDIVHATNTGAKYHAAGCRYLKSDIPMTRSDAQARGLTPCSACRP